MNHIQKRLRVLAIAPSSRGVGFVVLELDDEDRFVDWGVKAVKGSEKNRQLLAKAKKLITRYQPDVVALHNIETKQSRRSLRIRALNRQIIALTGQSKVKTALFSDQQVKHAFFRDGEGTKYAIAEMLARRLPQELASLLPPKRRAWESENARMDIFDAMTLAVMFREKQ